jgi:hypothetical protein
LITDPVRKIPVTATSLHGPSRHRPAGSAEGPSAFGRGRTDRSGKLDDLPAPSTAIHVRTRPNRPEWQARQPAGSAHGRRRKGAAESAGAAHWTTAGFAHLPSAPHTAGPVRARPAHRSPSDAPQRTPSRAQSDGSPHPQGPSPTEHAHPRATASFRRRRHAKLRQDHRNHPATPTTTASSLVTAGGGVLFAAQSDTYAAVSPL